MTPKENSTATREQQIYQAALTCFGRKGYYQTTMDDIVAESGLSKGTLYWYFKSKGDLFVSLFQQVMRPFAQEWEAIIARDDLDATGKLVASLSLFRAEMEELGSLARILIEAWALARHDEDVGRTTRELYEPYLDMMERVIEQGIAEGAFRVASPRATAMAIIALFDGITLAAGSALWRQDWHEVVDAAQDLVLGGLEVEDHRVA